MTVLAFKNHGKYFAKKSTAFQNFHLAGNQVQLVGNQVQLAGHQVQKVGISKEIFHKNKHGNTPLYFNYQSVTRFRITEKVCLFGIAPHHF